MFRLVVLCVCFAAASAGLLTPVAYPAPIGPVAYTGAIPYGPATAYINPGYSSIGLAPAPLAFSHLIKKRDDQQAPRRPPQIPTFPVADDDAPTIAKRSADVNYISAAPGVVLVTAPVTAPDHVLKKRSAVAYAAPAAITHQSLAYGSPFIQPYAAAIPIGYNAAGYAAAGYAAAPIGYASSYVAPTIAI